MVTPWQQHGSQTTSGDCEGYHHNNRESWGSIRLPSLDLFLLLLYIFFLPDKSQTDNKPTDCNDQRSHNDTRVAVLQAEKDAWLTGAGCDLKCRSAKSNIQLQIMLEYQMFLGYGFLHSYHFSKPWHQQQKKISPC